MYIFIDTPPGANIRWKYICADVILWLLVLTEILAGVLPPGRERVAAPSE